MLFKLSFRNMKKSFKDYAIYFLTLFLGVAIFYMFNSLDSQQAMLDISESQKEIIKLMISMLSVVSIFIAVILGLLIAYANKFLINRRKREFGIYMTLGMGRRQISKIILLETILVGILSLIAGLAIGIFASQFMSVLVAKMFEADMIKFTFIFSKEACIKTCVYFAIIYIAVMFIDTITVSRYKLINLLTATKKNEKIKLKNPILCILVFIIACVMLGWAYWKVSAKATTISTIQEMIKPIIAGIIGTVLVFWSLSGFILKLVQSNKKIYLKGTNMFVLRQLSNKVNTTVVSMSVICLMLFMTITVLSTSLSLQNSMKKDIEEMTPVDINLYKQANIGDTYTLYGVKKESTPEQREDSKYPIMTTLKENGYSLNELKDITEIEIYNTDEWQIPDSLGDEFEKIQEQYTLVSFAEPEDIIKVSDYNKIARLYGNQEYSLNDDEFMTICNFDSFEKIRNSALEKGVTKIINGKEYHSKYKECKPGFVQMSTSHTNLGIILVPDSFELKDSWKEQYFLAANYNATTDEGKEKIEKDFTNGKPLEAKGINLEGMSKISLVESSVSISTMVVFIAIYLGIVFLIASSAILALKQLTESSDNKQRYLILRKIGCDEKMINQALFRQIGIFFMMPLVLAIIHSIFGIQFATTIFEGLTSKSQLLPSIISTVIIMVVVYGLYFIATYVGSKNIIKE